MNTLTDLFLNQAFRRPGFSSSDHQSRPKARVSEKDGGLILKLDLPGVPSAGVSLSTTNRKLELSVEADAETNPFVSSFKESWIVADGYDLSSIEASLKDGLLTVTVPKVEPVSREITINAPSVRQIEDSAQ